ncbi:Stk1 family PASTA domain-containing Ser/Thr kinase [Bifidobacterium leontopitheci]|uniref:non-specific serine/threonine protein kinase n=1 Tax=Bifidobacterium leontopitheci TaxID=2650774 RepID=A0A6I1GHS6_9BIFI|nr:Stk1 family PASTA domain-containing Ser/Thr kinase [Bifidobacterium leontopitheci]KAB7791195.1 serine/threonine protein kinase [Bifidobacterium leontopitheci]
MSEVASTPEGQTIEGRYRIVRKIAEGGMATVYEAVDTRLERRVAIKIMHTQLAQGAHRAQFVERFHREAKSAASIANPHIVQVYDTGEFNGLDYLVMEYVHGVNLRHDMNLQGTFSVRETLRIVSETLDGLAAAHRVGVVHRDIKPENILINDRGHVQITDFGLAKAASQATLSSTGMLLGTAAYLAPEMIEDNQATMQGDLYSVGIMAWEMLTGDVPFVSDNPVTMVFKHVHEDVPSLTTVCPGIDSHVAAFVSHLTARAVEKRPADAADALQELRQMTAELPMDAWRYRKPVRKAADAGADGQPAGDLRDATEPALVGALPDPPVPPLFGTHGPLEGNAATTVLPPSAGGPSSQDDAAIDDTLPGAGSSPRVVSAKPKPTAVMPKGRDGLSSPNDVATQVIGDLDTREPTQIIGLMDVKPLDGGTAQHANDKPRKRSRKPLIITLVVVLVLAAASGGTGAWWYYLGPGSYWTLPQPSDVTCTAQANCSIVGASWNEYRSTLNVANIPFTVSEDYSDTVEKGKIISASPKQVGTHISKRHDGRVTITVSMGVKQATVPAGVDDPTTANGRDPITALKAAGFTNITEDKSKEEYSMDLAEGVVQSISVKPGETLDHNTAITVVLSKGPMPVTMPDIVGKTKDEAMTALDNARLKTTITEQNSDSVAAGSVISASPDSGTQLHWGDSAELVVSKGPETADVPNLVGKSKDEATKTLESLGFEVKTNGLNILGLVQQQSASGKTRLRDKDGKKTVITLTVV